jgi:hypothetical protein
MKFGRPVPYGLDFVNKLEPIKFNLKNQEKMKYLQVKQDMDLKHKKFLHLKEIIQLLLIMNNQKI